MGTVVDRQQRLRENLLAVRERIAEAARRAGRNPDDIRLVAVTKYVGPDVIRDLLRAGVQDLGESRAQQLARRLVELGSADVGLDTDDATLPADVPRWHMVGHLQRNKVRLLLPRARIVHSLDSQRLADELERRAAGHDCRVDVFIEVNVAGEASKYGVSPNDLPALAEYVTRCPHLNLRGLMTMAPYETDPERTRPHFARLRNLLDGLRASSALGPEVRDLSMGMSNDYSVAVEEGATIVRIGSALYEGLTAGG